jgi:predicted enzyme related to lactoylglutathione lyase
VTNLVRRSDSVNNQGFSLIVVPVTDLSAARSLYATMLGVEPYAGSPYYVGFRVGQVEFGLDPNGHRQGVTGPLPYCSVADLGSSLEALAAAGATVVQPPKAVGGGRSIAWVRDADHNLVGLMQTPS